MSGGAVRRAQEDVEAAACAILPDMNGMHSTLEGYFRKRPLENKE